MTLKIGSKGNEVKELQRLLHLYEDGIFGPITEEAVKEFQKANGLTVDGVVGDKTWAKLKGGLAKSSRTINEIIIHCSATKEGQDFTTADIKKWHLARGFSDIGYHYVIYRDGSVHTGRNVNISGAHCTGHNSHSIGVCYIGGLNKNLKPKDTRTDAQKDALLKLLKQLKQLYPKATIHGHYEYANKACPCFNVKEEYINLK
jgi:N-acetylmuramoyl-L-alanine amidase